jgi:hypothetical protein
MSRVFEATASLSYFDQQELVWETYVSPECRQETHWLEWKERLNLREKETHAKIAKAVLGFANRSPRTAGRYAGGCAYLLIGVRPGLIDGVERVDAASLEDGVGRYVSRKVQWRSDYVEIDEREVLVVQIEAPNWGDPMHPVEKSYQQGRQFHISAGDIYVRHQAATAKADEKDIEMLNERAARGQTEPRSLSIVGASQRQDELRIAVTSVPSLLLLDRLDLSTAAQDEFLRARKPVRTPSDDVRHLEDPAMISAVRVQPAGVEVQSFGGRDGRATALPALDAENMAELQRNLLPALVESAMARDIGGLSLALENPSDMTFAGVELELTAPIGCTLFVRRDVLSMLPQSPRHNQQSQLFRVAPGDEGRPARLGRLPSKESRRRSRFGAEKYVFDPVTVRAGRSVPLSKLFIAAATSIEPGLHQLQWSATATNAPKRINGSINVVIADAIWTPQALLAA